MAKLLTIQDLRNSVLSNYKIKGAGGKCDFSKYYDNPQEIMNIDPSCFLNGMPDFMRSFRDFDYRNSLDIMQNVLIKQSKKNNLFVTNSINENDYKYNDKSAKII